MIHALITAAIAAMAWPFGWHQEAALLVAVFYAGREHAQAEYRAIYNYYDNTRANSPWYCGLEAKAWTAKSIMDCLGPIAIAIIAQSV